MVILCKKKKVHLSGTLWISDMQAFMLVMGNLFTSMRVSAEILYLLTESMVVIVICMITFPVSTLYCFGVSAGDIQLEREDDGSSPPITLSIPFRFFGASENILYVSQLHVIRLHFTYTR